MFSFFSAKKILGLDIGTSTIKVAELNVARSGTTLTAFSIVPTPPNAIAGGEILDTVSLTQSVRAVLDEIQSKRKNVVTGIWGTAVIIKKISLPKMEAKLIEEQIRWEAEQYIPFDINEINLDYHIFNRPNPNPEIMDILLVAAKKDFIFKFAEVVESAERHCTILDVSAFALANTFFHNYGKNIDYTACILNIGAGFTNFVVVESGEVLFCRDVPVGGMNYTLEISRYMSITFEEAENLKLSAASGQETPQEVQNVLQATHESVCEEIRRTLDFYSATGTDTPIKKIFLCGGAGATPGLMEALSQSLQLPVEFMNPFVNMKYDTKKFSPEFISQIAAIIPTSMGLAMRKPGDK
ncbi:MAG: type IV pilus assembly protein PilM [Bdellovibrionales bacterium]